MILVIITLHRKKLFMKGTTKNQSICLIVMFRIYTFVAGLASDELSYGGT